MKILYVHERFGALAGAEANAFITAQELGERGHQTGILHGPGTGKNEDGWSRVFKERFALAGDRTDRNVRMHSGALRQVLLNLFLNAAEALESRKSPGLVLVAFEDAGDVVRILVEDDGPGVEAAVGDRLFEPFVTSRGDRGGTGLGLSICRGLVEATGGRLELERTSKAGTRFAVTLPVAAT